MQTKNSVNARDLVGNTIIILTNKSDALIKSTPRSAHRTAVIFPKQFLTSKTSAPGSVYIHPPSIALRLIAFFINSHTHFPH